MTDMIDTPERTRTTPLHALDPSAPWDVLVIGAGPCGSAAAYRSAASGARTLLVDRSVFPRHKACGCCLGAEGRRLAQQIAPVLESTQPNPPASLDRIRIQTPTSRLEAPITPGLACTRADLDSSLARGAVDAGAVFLHGTHARFAELTDDHRIVSLRSDGIEVTAKASVVIAAAGLSGRYRDMASPDHRYVRPNAPMGVSAIIDWPRAPIPDRTISMNLARDGYVGLVRLPGGRINIAAALAPAFVRAQGGPPGAIRRTLEQLGIDTPDHLDSAHWLGAPTLTRRTPRPAGPRLLIAGDAAGYVEPFTGEGMSLALRSGFRAGAIAAEAARTAWSHNHEKQWLTFDRRQLRTPQRRCAAITRLIARPGLASIAIRLLEQDHDAAGAMVRLFTAAPALGSAA